MRSTEPTPGRACGVPGTVILGGRAVCDAQRATSAVLETALAASGSSFARWVLLDTLTTGALPPERDRLVPGLAAALASGPVTVELMLDRAELAGLIRIVSAPDGDPGAVRIELTAAGTAHHRRIRSVVHRVADELYAGIPDQDLEAFDRVLAEIARRADGWVQRRTATTVAGAAR